MSLSNRLCKHGHKWTYPKLFPQGWNCPMSKTVFFNRVPRNVEKPNIMIGLWAWLRLVYHRVSQWGFHGTLGFLQRFLREISNFFLRYVPTATIDYLAICKGVILRNDHMLEAFFSLTIILSGVVDMVIFSRGFLRLESYVKGSFMLKRMRKDVLKQGSPNILNKVPVYCPSDSLRAGLWTAGVEVFLVSVGINIWY